MLTYQDRKRAMLWLQEALFKAEDSAVLTPKLMDHVRDVLTLEWSSRMNKTLGLAVYKRNKSSAIIRLSTILWESAEEKERRETVYHELAHIIVSAERAHDPIQSKAREDRRSHHGSKWRYTMKKLGYPNADRCHDVVNEEYERSRGKVPMYCACRAWWIASKKAFTFKGICRRCRTPLTFGKTSKDTHIAYDEISYFEFEGKSPLSPLQFVIVK